MRISAIFLSAIIIAATAITSAHALTTAQKADLQKLSPELRAQVKERLGPKQTVDGVLETMLLNRLSQMYADARYFRVDRDKATVVVVRSPGDEKTIQYDPVTWVIVQ